MPDKEEGKIVLKAVDEDCTDKFDTNNSEKGKVGWILLWAVGVPIPILFALFLMRGCT